MSKRDNKIVGRYAPSPTGDLHLGNLRSALIAWLHCRLQGGEFLLRMEDLDQPRVVAGSADGVLHDLTWLGIDWDGEVVYQSRRQSLYQQAFDSLRDANLVYPCFCSRRELNQIASAPHQADGVYPGLCRDLSADEVSARQQHKDPAWRVRVDQTVIEFTDQCHGRQREALAEHVGDFVVWRADGLFAYQLAVVVDDLAQGVTQVVRGDDLLTSTARQLYLQSLLEPGKVPVEYCHVPLLLDAQGKRMAKRDGSESATQWRERGATAEALVGTFAAQLGLLQEVEELSAQALLSRLSFDQLLGALQAAKS